MQPDPVDSDYPDPIENPNLLIGGGGERGVTDGLIQTSLSLTAPEH